MSEQPHTHADGTTHTHGDGHGHTHSHAHTKAVLNRLISRILIGEIKKIDGQRTQEVKIIYNFVGEMSR